MTKYLTLLYMVLATAACSSQISTNNATSSAEANTADSSVKIADGLQIKLNITSNDINRLKDLKAVFELKNISDGVIIYNFRNGCQYGFTVTRGQQKLFDSKKHLLCTMALTELKLKPGQIKTFTINLASFKIQKDFKQGTYQLNAFLLEEHSPAVTASFKIE